MDEERYYDKQNLACTGLHYLYFLLPHPSLFVGKLLIKVHSGPTDIPLLCYPSV